MLLATAAAAAVATSIAVVSPAVAAPCPTVFVHERFMPAAEAHGHHGAVTYDKALVPTSAMVFVAEKVMKGDGGTLVFVGLHAVAPHHTFGIHVHTKPCGTEPDSSGPHYQNVKDPKQPSTNPQYANPHNEVWLDLTTNGNGDGRARSMVEWRFRSGQARSVVIHEHATGTHMGSAGQAGDRLACVNVPFKP